MMYKKSNFNFVVALGVAAASGFVSLSQEMVWMRALAFATAGRPTVFANVLGFFLVGVALGALLSERALRRRNTDIYLLAGSMFLVAALLNQFLLPIVATAFGTIGGNGGLGTAYFAVVLTSLALGGVLPLAAEAGRRGDFGGNANVGRYVSWIYVANIVGSTAGPMLTGFWLFNVFTLTQVQFIITLIAMITGAAIALMASVRRLGLILSGAAAAGVLLLAVTGVPSSAPLLHKFHYKKSAAERPPYKHLVENRSGIISVIPEPGRPDIIEGGGIFDGRFNTDPHVTGNRIERAYMIAGLHSNPKRVLEIGLSSGSWTRVLSMYGPVERIDVVEINPGYPELVSKYPEVSPVLDDPRITLHDDDGRRWLKNHPDDRFDFILQNTTFHWRSNITALVSKEYLELVKSRLNPGGVFYYNTTGSNDIIKTAIDSFKHVVKFRNFIAASDAPFNISAEQRRINLLTFTNHGKPVFTQDDPVLAQFVNEPLRTPNPGVMKNFNVITDDNMYSEYKTDRKLFSGASWSKLFEVLH